MDNLHLLSSDELIEKCKEYDKYYKEVTAVEEQRFYKKKENYNFTLALYAAGFLFLAIAKKFACRFFPMLNSIIFVPLWAALLLIMLTIIYKYAHFITHGREGWYLDSLVNDEEKNECIKELKSRLIMSISDEERLKITSFLAEYVEVNKLPTVEKVTKNKRM